MRDKTFTLYIAQKRKVYSAVKSQKVAIATRGSLFLTHHKCWHGDFLPILVTWHELCLNTCSTGIKGRGYFLIKNKILRNFPHGPVVKNQPTSTWVHGSIPGPGRCHMPREQLSPTPNCTEPMPSTACEQQQGKPQWKPELCSYKVAATHQLWRATATHCNWSSCRSLQLESNCISLQLEVTAAHCNWRKPAHSNETQHS